MAATDAFRRLDADAAPDGLAESDLLELYRRMVLLRTYDERSVVYHRQGRIGTYAIFWNHEAIQAGATFALARRRLDLPVVPRVGDRARARHAGRDDPAVVARPSVGLVEPGRLERRVDLRADRDARPARGRARVGQEAARRGRGRDGVLRRRRDERGRVPRGRQPRGGDERAGGLRLQQQPAGRSRRRSRRRRAPRRSPTRRSATASRACASTGSTCSPSTRRRARRSSARAPAAARR